MSSRALNDGEISLARDAFGDGIDYSRVRLCSRPGRNPVAWLAWRNGNPAIALLDTIYLLDGALSADFSRGGNRGLFMHEMTHIWQYRALGAPRFLLRYGHEFAACGFRAERLYRYEEGRTGFAEATLEAQAEMVSDFDAARVARDFTLAARLECNLQGSGLYGL